MKITNCNECIHNAVCSKKHEFAAVTDAITKTIAGYTEVAEISVCCPHWRLIVTERPSNILDRYRTGGASE